MASIVYLDPSVRRSGNLMRNHQCTCLSILEYQVGKDNFRLESYLEASKRYPMAIS